MQAGVPTLIGPGFANFADLVPPLREAGRLQVVEAVDLEREVRARLADSPLRPRPAQPLPESLRGALDRTWALIAPHLPPVG
ncbi:MAG: hypothetical protein IPO28_13600 [Holophagaceae bacterium]|nr:hypothetical protein [Holophagaceae bacterium]